jgi:uncharacterized protein YifN (PemK superfamily)
VALPPFAVPHPGQVLMCDFGPDPENIEAPGVMVGPLVVKPEIWKERPSVVISARFGMAVVVPFSTSKPSKKEKFHHFIPAGKYRFLTAHEDNWVKCDLIESVSNVRLDRPYLAGRRSIVNLDAGDLKGVREAVLHALALESLTGHL